MASLIESLVIGAVAGAVFGVAALVSRRFVALLSSVAAIAITITLVDQGLAGLEAYGRGLLAEARQHGVLLFGAVLGLIGVGAFADSRRRGSPSDQHQPPRRRWRRLLRAFL